MNMTNTETSEKNEFLWVVDIKNIIRDLMKFKIFFLKIKYEGELRISESNLFHSNNASGKKIKKSYFLLYTGQSPSFDYF